MFIAVHWRDFHAVCDERLLGDMGFIGSFFHHILVSIGPILVCYGFPLGGENDFFRQVQRVVADGKYAPVFICGHVAVGIVSEVHPLPAPLFGGYFYFNFNRSHIALGTPK